MRCGKVRGILDQFGLMPRRRQRRAYLCNRCNFPVTGCIIINIDKLKRTKEIVCPNCGHRNAVDREDAIRRLTVI